MPKFSKIKKKEIGGLLQEMGLSGSMVSAVLRSAQTESEQEATAATKELHRQLLKDLSRQHKQGVKFCKADLQEFLGQDEIPPEFRELLKGDGASPDPHGPVIAFEPPAGWSSKQVASALHIRKGRKLMGQITVIDDFHWGKVLRSNEIRESQQKPKSPGIDGGWEKSPVQFGDSHGFKYCYVQTEPYWKRVQYLLEVLGGKVNAVLDAGGKDFDERVFEDSLHTLRISQATG